MSHPIPHNWASALPGHFTLAPLNIPGDMGHIHDWVNREYARYWGMQGMSLEKVCSTYEEIISPEHTQAFLGRYDGQPAFLIETYHPSQTSLIHHYSAHPTDRGMHILVAPTNTPIHGFTRAAFFSVMAFIFKESDVERVVVEPDIRNEKIRALNRLAGFEEIRAIDLPETSTTPGKRAMLSICTRAAFERAQGGGPL